MKSREIDSWATVFEAANIDEANIVKGLLELAELPVILEREAVAAIYGLAVGPLSEVAVKVPQELAERALQLLQSAPYGVVPEE